MTRWFYASILLTLATAGGTWYVAHFRYDELPDRVPTHWGIRGEADGWADKEDAWQAFLFVPCLMIGFQALTLVLPWLSPGKFDLDRFRRTYHYVMFLATGLFAYIHLGTLLASLRPDFDVSKMVLGGICLFFALMGNVMGKVRRNFYVGVKTPWTLASETVWNRTHRVAGWLWVGAGVAGCALIGAGVPFYWSFGLIMVAAFVPVFYSLWLYKRLERQGRLEPPAAPNQEVSVG